MGGAIGPIFGSIFEGMSEAAEGTEATRNMVAKRGRAKFLAEKSLGYQDAGATSMLIILTAMKDYIIHN